MLSPGAADTDTAGSGEAKNDVGSEFPPLDVSQRQIDEFFTAAAVSGRGSKRRRIGSGSDGKSSKVGAQGPATLWEQTAQEAIRLHKRRALLLKRLAPLQAELSSVETDLATVKLVDTAEKLSLVEIWTHVFRYLTYGDMVQATDAWKLLLDEVAPRVEKLVVDHPREFVLISPIDAAERFPNVERVSYRGREQRKEIGQASECQLVTFLCTFPKLWVVEIEELRLSREVNTEILGDICRSYTLGTFQSEWIVNIHGISCWGDEGGNDDESCSLCQSACSSFPARGVANANFAETYDCWHECRGGTLGYMCISYEDGMDILAQRYSGREYIESDDAILDVVDDIAPFCKNDQGVLDLYSGDIKYFEPLATRRISASFAASKIDILRAHGACPEKVDRKTILGHLYKHAPGRIGEAYFYRSEFDELVEAGLPLKETDFILVDDMKEVLKRKGLLPRDDE